MTTYASRIKWKYRKADHAPSTRETAEPDSDRQFSTLSREIHRKSACPCGGGCPGCQSTSALKISQPSDPAEIEADRTADQVMRMVSPVSSTAVHVRPSTDVIHTKCSSCEEEDELPGIDRKKSVAADKPPAGDASAHVRSAISGGGRELASETRAFFEPRLGYDLSGVRIHTGGAAETSASSINAEAYTIGQDIVFNRGRYQPETDEGKHLIAHELAHVAQQLGTGRLERKIQPSFRPACTKLSADRSIGGLIRGAEAHSLITEDFKRSVTGATGASIPGATADVIRTDAICGGPSTMIDPEEIGDPGLGSSRGKPDLARRKGNVLEVAEIKPAALECLVDGEVQLARYILQGNMDLGPGGAEETELKAWKKRKKIKTIKPMSMSTYPAKTLRVLDVQGELKIELAWCTQGLLAYKVSIDDKKKKKDKDKKKDKSKDKAADSPDAEKKPAVDATDSPDAKKPKADLPDTPDTKTPKPKPKLKNFGFGICILCDVGGGGNAGVGVGILVDGQSYGTVSAGIVYDANGNAVGTASAGVGMHMSGDAAGTIGASAASSVSGESAVSAGASIASDSSSNSLGSASVGKTSGSDTNAVATASAGEGENAQGTSILSAAKGKSADAAAGSGKTPGDAGATTQDGVDGGITGSKDASASGAGQSSDAGTAGKAKTEGGKGAADAGAVTAPDAGTAGGGGEESSTLQIPGTTPEQLNAAIAQAAELDALLQSATPAQRNFMEFLSKQERAGYFPVSKVEWVKNVMHATQGLSDQQAEILSQYSWAESNVSGGDLKTAVDEALARNTVDPKQTSHNFIYGQPTILPFTAADVDWNNVSTASLIRRGPLNVGKNYKGLVVFYFKKKDGTDFFAKVYEVDVLYQQIVQNDEAGKPHHFVFGVPIVFRGPDGSVVENYLGFAAADDVLAEL